MTNPSSRKQATPEELRARTRALQAKLEGLTIAELMRGPIDGPQHGGSGPHRSHDPNQPRVPKGHFDGGRWTRAGHASDGRHAAVNNTRAGTGGTIPVRLATAADTQGALQNVDITIPSTLPPGVFPRPAPPEIVLNVLNPDATLYSRREVPDVAGAITGTVTKLANGFEVTDGTFAIITRNPATKRIDAAVFSVPRGVTATVTLSPNGDDIQISFSTGI